MPQIQAAGTVHSIAWEGRRIQFWEKFNSNGREFSRLWTCWFETPQHDILQEQDWVEVHGELSTKVGSYKPANGDEKPIVEHHINEAKVVQVKTAAEQQKHADKFEDAPF